MPRLIFNVILILVACGLISISLVIVVKALKFMIEWTAQQLGYEIKDIWNKLPRIKFRKRYWTRNRKH